MQAVGLARLLKVPGTHVHFWSELGLSKLLEQGTGKNCVEWHVGHGVQEVTPSP